MRELMEREQIASDAGLRRSLRLMGLERAGTFTWERTARRTLEVLMQQVNN